MNKLLNLLFHPSKLINKIEWRYYKRKLCNIGSKSSMGVGFSIINPENIIIGNNFIGGQNISLWTWNSNNQSPKLTICDNVSITDRCIISCSNQVTIGNGCLLGRDTFITDNAHGENNTINELNIPPYERKIYSKGPVILGDNVWTGKNVCILPNVKIGSGAIIGANSVVTHDVPPHSIAVGSPAKVVKIIKQ